MPAILILGSLPFALVGAVWFLYFLGYHFSIASGVGMIALSGLAAEFGIIMLVYLDDTIERYRMAGKLNNKEDLYAALIEGAALRVRPKAMTVAVILAGLIPILIGTAQVRRR
jgi:copper/silver efflux system protein